jgi:DHA2 family lincomycin resistance protein-like MFS transporter
LLTLGILVPLSGLLMKWFTTRQLFLTAVALSIIGAVTGAIAGSFETLMTARIFQATGTAILLPLLFNSALILFSPEKRGSAMGLVALVFTAAPAVGPTISGLLIVKFSWHWIFWVSCVFMLVSLVFGAIYIQNITKITRPKIESLSLFMSIFGFGSLVFGFSMIGESESDWNSMKAFIFIVISIVILTIFVFRQLTIKKPLVDIRVFKKPMFVIGTLLILICMMVNLSAMLILPMYLIRVLGMNALSAGLVLLPGGLIFALLAPVIGRLFDKYGPKWLIILGLITVVVSLCFLSNLSPVSTISQIVPLHCCLMIGIVMVWNPAQTNGMNALLPEKYPDGTAIMNTLLQVAGAISTATAVSVMKVGETRFLENLSLPDDLHSSLALTAGIQDAFFFTIFVAATGLLVGLFIRRVKVEDQHNTE